MEVTYNFKKKTIKLLQLQYIENILERHGMADCKPAATLIEVNLKLKKLEMAKIKEDQQLIGSLMYASIGTKSDITYDVGILL